jgi:hypothetical protein
VGEGGDMVMQGVWARPYGTRSHGHPAQQRASDADLPTFREKRRIFQQEHADCIVFPWVHGFLPQQRTQFQVTYSKCYNPLFE